MRQSVRERVRGLSPSQAAILAIVVVVLSILVTVIMTADSDAPALPDAETESASAPETESGAPSSIGGVVAGFGLVGVWFVAGVFMLVRAQRSRAADDGAEADPGGG